MFDDFRKLAKEDAKNDQRYWGFFLIRFESKNKKNRELGEKEKPPSPMASNASSASTLTAVKNASVVMFTNASWRIPFLTLTWTIYTAWKNFGPF